MQHRSLPAKIALIGFFAGGAVALVACLGTRFGLFDYDRGIEVLLPGVAIGAVGLAAGLVWLWLALKENDSRGSAHWRGGTDRLRAARGHSRRQSLALLQPAADPRHFHRYRRRAGIRHAARRRKGAPNPASYDGPVLVTYGGERIDGVGAEMRLSHHKPMEKLNIFHDRVPLKAYYANQFWRCLNTVNGLGWRVASFDIKTRNIEATDRSLWFGIVSDIVIRVRTAGPIGVRIDVRAKSRMGTADMGRNAELVHDFLHALPP